MPHHVNHGGAFGLQYSFNRAIKGRRGVLKQAAATLVLLKLEGSGTPLPTNPKWHMSTWPPHRSSPRKLPLGTPLSKPKSH